MSDSSTVRALRAATTVDRDTPETVTARVHEMLRAVMERNELSEDQVVSVLFTATADVISMFPATAAREIGFGSVPLLCAAEIPVPGAKPRCIRMLMHVETTVPRAALRHVYLHDAQGLNDGLPS